MQKSPSLDLSPASPVFGGEMTRGAVTAALTGAAGGGATAGADAAHVTLRDADPVALPADADIDAVALPELGAVYSA